MIRDAINNFFIRLWLKFQDLTYTGQGMDMKDGEALISKDVSVYTHFKPGMSWGYVHPGYEYNALGIYNRGIYEILGQLRLVNESFNETIVHQGIEYTPSIVSGCVHSKRLYKYGQFEIDCEVPENGKTWPAFWFYGTTWPPELDIFEFMPDTDKRGKKTLNAGIYYANPRKDSGYHKRMGTNTHGPVKIGVDWTPNYIRWYYNGFLFKEITSPKIMKYFREPMYLVVSMGVGRNYDEKVFEEILLVESVMYKPYK